MAEVILKVLLVETGQTKTMKFGQTEQCSAVSDQIAKSGVFLISGSLAWK